MLKCYRALGFTVVWRCTVIWCVSVHVLSFLRHPKVHHFQSTYHFVLESGVCPSCCGLPVYLSNYSLRL
uniref:Uncharacterized protein n=1 Tax=Anguilla anguilla TaxID=7936 RepID=A0A0E9XTA9_ANGAN